MLFLAYMGSTLVMTHLSNKYNVKEVELVMKNQELGRVEEYSRTMEELYDNIRKFKHDYKNILLSLNTFIEEKDYDALERYYKKEILTTEHMLDGQDYAAKLKNIKIPSLKALLSSKLIRASQKGIEVYTDITEEISTTGLDEIDGLRVFGVLLDNAIEGTADLADKHLSFGAVYKGNSVVFVIENSCQDEIPPVFRLIEKGFSTKGENHGMGLYNVKEIINKYDNGLLNIESSEGIFRVELWIRMVS